MKKNSKGLNKLLKQKQLLLTGLMMVILSFVVFGPVASRLKNRLAIKKSLSAELTKLETKLSVLNGIDTILIGVRVDKMEAVFPSKKPVVSLMGTLSALASERNLKFGGISLSPGKLGDEEVKANAKLKAGGASDLKDLSFGFDVTGNYPAVLGFMADLENVAPLMKIEEINLSLRSLNLDPRSDLIMTASIKVSAYYQAPPKTLGPVSQPVALLNRNDEVLLNKLVGFRILKSVMPIAPTGQQNLFGSGL